MPIFSNVDVAAKAETPAETSAPGVVPEEAPSRKPSMTATIIDSAASVSNTMDIQPSEVDATSEQMDIHDKVNTTVPTGLQSHTIQCHEYSY